MRFISNGDFLFPFSWPLYAQQQFYTWSYQKGAANPDGIIRMPGRLVDLLVFAMAGNVGFGYFYLLSSMLVVFAAFFAFARYFLRIKKLSVQLLGALFFAVNPIFLGNLAKVGLVFAAAMLPLCFVVLQRAFEQRKVRYFLLWVVLLNISLIHPYTFIVNAVASGCYVAYKAWNDKRLILGNIPKFLLLGGIAILLNAYFLLPQASMRTLSKNSLTNTISSTPVDYTALVDVSNTGDIFTGLSLSKNTLKDFEFYNPVYANFYFIGAFLFYVVLLAAYLRIEPRLKADDKRQFVLLMSVLLVLFLLATVKFLHVDALIKFLIHMPGGWAFRSPLKWQLYIPLVLFTMLVLILQHVHVAWRRRTMYGGLAAAFILMNAFLLADVYRKILTPRTITHFAALQQTDLEHKNILLVSSGSCMEYEQENPRITTELNQILISKHTQVKQVGQGDLEMLNTGSYDYVLDCQDAGQATLRKHYDFALTHSFVKGNFRLYENRKSVPYVRTTASLFRLGDRTQQTGSKYDFAQDQLHKRLDFSSNDTPNEALPMTNMQDAFDGLSFKNIRDGALAASTKPLRSGAQTLYIKKNNNQPLYYKAGDNALAATTQSKPGHTQVTGGKDAEQLPVHIAEGKNFDFTYTDPNYHYQNMIANASLEQGLWQKKVNDCYAYDNQPQVDMKLDTRIASAGKQSLELSSKNHIACTGPNTVSVKPGQHYLLSFDYRTDGGQFAGYYAGFNDPDTTFVSDRLEDTHGKWQTFTKDIQAPKDGRTLQLVLYAYPDGANASAGIAHYDNFNLVAIPDVQSRFYLVSEPRQQLQQPASMDFTSYDPTKTVVRVHGARTPFYVATNESYSAVWRLALADSAAKSWWPFARVRAVSDQNHLNINGSMNGWYVDPQQLCKNNAACTKNADGSTDITLVMEFAPQRWFYLGALVSGVTFAAATGYFVYLGRRDRRQGRYKRWR